MAITTPSENLVITSATPSYTPSTATTPTTSAGQRRIDQYGVLSVFAVSAASAHTRRPSAYTRRRPSTISGAAVSSP
jgi:hypothetical protein